MKRRINDGRFNSIAVNKIATELNAGNWRIMGGQQAVKELLSRPLKELPVHTIENILTVLNRNPSPLLKEEKKALTLEMQRRRRL